MQFRSLDDIQRQYGSNAFCLSEMPQTDGWDREIGFFSRPKLPGCGPGLQACLVSSLFGLYRDITSRLKPIILHVAWPTLAGLENPSMPHSLCSPNIFIG